MSLILMCLLLLAVGYFIIDPKARCWWLRHQLLAAVDNASTILVVEHSDRFDRGGFDPNYKEVKYATISLTTDQIESLRRAFPLTRDNSGWEDRMCIFEEHHYIAITRKDGSVLTLHICFHCGQIELGTHDGNMPEGWDSTLRKFVSSVGLHPDGPWDHKR